MCQERRTGQLSKLPGLLRFFLHLSLNLIIDKPNHSDGVLGCALSNLGGPPRVERGC